MPKIVNKLSRPIYCDQCNGRNIALVNNDHIYGRSYGAWPLVWYCHDCQAAVGCHKKTDIPLGFFADKETRFLRMKAHEAFDPLWKKSNSVSRFKAYEWLAHELHIRPVDCHISWFDSDTCRRVIDICKGVKQICL